jgi:hypothetical protein
MNPDVVWLWIMLEPHGLDPVKSHQVCFADAVHSIYHAPITRENHGECEIRILYQSRVIGNLAACHTRPSADQNGPSSSRIFVRSTNSRSKSRDSSTRQRAFQAARPRGDIRKWYCARIAHHSWDLLLHRPLRPQTSQVKRTIHRILRIQPQIV